MSDLPSPLLRPILTLDGAACALGAALILLEPTAWDWVSLPESWRMPVTIILALFAVLALTAAFVQTRGLVLAAASINTLLAIGGLIALTQTSSDGGFVIVLIVAIADTAMAVIQYLLGRELPA